MNGRTTRSLTFAANFAALVTLAGCCPELWYEATEAEPVVRLPQDEAPHHCGGIEWWYYTGLVETNDGRQFGIEAVVFHVPPVPLSPAAEGWAAHFAVLDVQTGVFAYDEYLSFTPPTLGAADASGFALDLPLVSLTGGGGDDHVVAASPDGSFALDLALTDQRGAVLHGDGGYVPFGGTREVFYYSRPEMAAFGTLSINGESHEVTGAFWFDRQWGRDLINPWKRWDWFSVRLDDGGRIMLYVIRETPTVAFGTYLPPAGEPAELTDADFTVATTAAWTSPHTGRAYPVAWRIELPAYDLTLDVSAVADDQEIDARRSTLNVYWEGLCTVAGECGDVPVGGHAYVEITNTQRP